MTKVIGVRFRTAGKIYFFDPVSFEIKRGDHVIVETARGIEFGTVVTGAADVEDEEVVQPLKPVIRIANQRDMEQEAENRIKEKEAFQICLEKIKKHGLDMKLVDAEYTFDNNKVLFYFTADGRIDFRELVKDLAGIFKTRIELRQIGVRDETKIMGGIGICGRDLCCHSYLADFVPVSIKMAKEQNLSLNPTKISGVCGRLMCCLKNEEEIYEELNRKLPGVGDHVITEDGLRGEVQSVNVLRQLVKVIVEESDEKEIKEYPAEKLQFRRRHGKKEKVDLSREEMKELERLEEEAQLEDQETQQETGRRQGGRGRNRQESGQRRDRREAQGGEQRRDRREGQEAEQRRDRREGQDGEQRRDRREGQEAEQRRDRREGQDSEQRRDRREGQEAGQRRDRYDRPENRSRQNVQRQEGEQKPGEGEKPENGRRRDRWEGQEAEQRRDRRERQNRNRQDDRRQNGTEQKPDGGVKSENEQRQAGGQENSRRQNGRNRYNRRNRQEGQTSRNDNQSQE